MSATKLPGAQRRMAIVKAVRRVFAEKGFHGTTTRELADAAGVSEALLFRHFPNKHALYSAMQLSCCDEHEHERFERLRALEPSASTLVLLVHFMVWRVLGGSGSTDEDEQAIQHRLMVHSLAEDGEFARLRLRQLTSSWIPKVERSIKAAIESGKAGSGPVRPRLAAWFAHDLAIAVRTNLLPSEPIVQYGVSQERLIEQTVWFSLRGMGLKEEVIQQYYDPKSVGLFTRCGA